MLFCVHSSKLAREHITQSLNESISQLGFPLEDASSLVIMPSNRLFRKTTGRFNPRDNVENAWALVRSLLKLSLVDPACCITVFDSANETEEKEDFFHIHCDQQVVKGDNARSVIHRGQVYLIEGATDELSAVMQCRAASDLATLPQVDVGVYSLAHPVLEPNLSRPHRIKLTVPRRLVRAVRAVPELFPTACLIQQQQEDAGEEAAAGRLAQEMLRSLAKEPMVECIVTVTRFSYAVLHHKLKQKQQSGARSVTAVVFEGLAHLILENDLYDASSLEEVDWFSSKPLRDLFLKSDGDAAAPVVGDGTLEAEDDDTWLVPDADEDDDEDENTAWAALERELDNTREFDGVLHESASRPVDFSVQEFMRILHPPQQEEEEEDED